jgi:hypothetical protein
MANKHCRVLCNKQGCWDCVLCSCFLCGVCGGFEGSLPTECPHEKMTDQQREDVYAGKLDYVNGKWVRVNEN